MINIPAEVIAATADSDDDFGFEMRIGGMLNGVSGATVLHGETYSDPNTATRRQSDFRFRLFNGVNCIQLALETKNFRPEQPLIISGFTRPPLEAIHTVVVSSRALHFPSAFAHPQFPSSLYPMGEFTGKSADRYTFVAEQPQQGSRDKRTPVPAHAISAGDKEIFTALSQALASSFDLLLDATRFSTRGPPKTATITLPVLVVPDGLLWIIGYDSNGHRTVLPQMVSECHYYVSHKYMIPAPNGAISCRIPHMHFITKSGLAAFLSKIQDPKHSIWTKWFEGAHESQGY